MPWYDDPPHNRWAAVFEFSRCIAVKTFSGYWASYGDPRGANILLEPSVSNEALGRAVEEALERSRYVYPKEDDEFCYWETREEHYNEWAEDIRVKYEYKSIRNLFARCKFCFITKLDGILTIEPYRRKGAHVHEKLDDDQKVLASELMTPACLGAQVRLAISRCL